jgi:hypothetical protein
MVPVIGAIAATSDVFRDREAISRPEKPVFGWKAQERQGKFALSKNG